MLSPNSISTSKILPMSTEEAVRLVKRMMGCYPSLSLHDPQVYVAELVTVLTGYPLDIGAEAIEKAKKESPKFIPTVPELRIACETLVKSKRDAWTYARQWEEQSRRQLREREAAEAATEPIEHRWRVADRIRNELRAAGFRIGAKREYDPRFTVAAVKEKLGSTEEQWAALPDAPRPLNLGRTVESIVDKVCSEPERGHAITADKRIAG
jgi:hypothetical protein